MNKFPKVLRHSVHQFSAQFSKYLLLSGGTDLENRCIYIQTVPLRQNGIFSMYISSKFDFFDLLKIKEIKPATFKFLYSLEYLYVLSFWYNNIIKPLSNQKNMLLFSLMI